MADPTTEDLLANSADYQAMYPAWAKVDAILTGVEALRAAPSTYLPQFPNESADNYAYRNKNSRFTNVYADIVENLASRPFSKEVGLVDGSETPEIKRLVEDIDRSGNHLHVFAQEVFFNGINYGLDWILVDHTKLPAGATLADERRIGSRPFWVRVPATAMLEVRSAMIGGSEQFTYARIDEGYLGKDDAGDDEQIARVRIFIRDELFDEDTGDLTGFGPARFEIWEKPESAQAWELKDSGDISIGVIPLVPFMTGRRKLGTWQVPSPMKHVAGLQIEHYQQETNLKSAKELTAFPMFKALGLDAPEDGKPIPVGPSTILYAPMDQDGKFGDWGIVEISASSLKFLSDEVDKTERQMRELGRQPLVAGTAGITQISAALASQKASSAIQAWAFLLKDSLERAFRLTLQWMGQSAEPEVRIHTDFAVEMGGENELTFLDGLNGRNKLSDQTLWEESKRRGVLSPEFTAEREETRLIAQLPGDEDFEDADPASDLPPEDDLQDASGAS